MNNISDKKFVVAITIFIALIIFGIWMFLGHTEKISLTEANLLNGNQTPTSTPNQDIVQKPIFHYIEIVNSCGPYYNLAPCVNMRSGPGLEYSVVDRLRNGVVLKVEEPTLKDNQWHKIIFDKEIRYPERVAPSGWYVAVDEHSVLSITNTGDEFLGPNTAATTKRIIVVLSQEMLYAYDGDTLFIQNPISTGLEFTPTPVGTFKVYKKTPSRYMQGPIPGISDQYYDLPGVPWNLYFTVDGAVIHGAYWHDHFGKPWSHGCVNLPPEKARDLYLWADIGTTVTVKN